MKILYIIFGMITWRRIKIVTPHYVKKVLKYHKYTRSEPDSELQAELIKIADLPKKEFDEERERLELEFKIKYEDDKNG